MTDNALMTIGEAAAILGKSTRTLRRMIDSGDLAYVQKLPGPNGPYLFDPAEVWRVAGEQDKAPAPAATP